MCHLTFVLRRESDSDLESLLSLRDISSSIFWMESCFH